MRVAAVRAAAALLLVLMLYVVAGQGLQGWIGLHIDAWRERPGFGDARDRYEWDRVGAGLALAQAAWPWQTSLYSDAARWWLFGAAAGFETEPDAGEAILDLVSAAEVRAPLAPDLVALEVRGSILYGDYAGAADAVAALRRLAPHARVYWQPLVRWLRTRAKRDPELVPLADAVANYYAGWRSGS